MTVVIGEREQGVPDQRAVRSGDGICHDLDWEQRLKRYRQASTLPAPPEWQPSNSGRQQAMSVGGDDQIEPGLEPEAIFDPIRPGLLTLYAARMAHARSARDEACEAQPGERLLVGSIAVDRGERRTLAFVRETARIGRGRDEHYRDLHPPIAMRYGRLRSGGSIMHVRRGLAEGAARELGMAIGTARVGFQTLASGLVGQPRLAGSRRMVLATFFAVLLVVSAATTGFASQYRYEVRSGDTIESVAGAFGVNPDSIRASSYLPDGDYLSAGQVIVVPEPGQGPSDAAQQAAANEGTSPWAYTAHWVEYGENPAAIAADYGVDVNVLMDFNGIGDPLDLVTGSRLIIPDTGSVSTGSTDSASPADAWFDWIPVPDYKQRRNLSCEYAAAHAAAMTFGWAPSEGDFIDAIPNALNPHYGYRGNIDGWWGNTEDYGIYAEPLAPVLNDWGFNGEVMYTFGDAGPLIAHLDAGHPVVTWLGFWGDTRERLTDDGNYSVFAGMHVVTIYGYDDDGVLAMDPARGEKAHYSWDFFIKMWTVVDGMSLAVYPF